MNVYVVDVENVLCDENTTVEKNVIKAFQQWSRNKTVYLITHRTLNDVTRLIKPLIPMVSGILSQNGHNIHRTSNLSQYTSVSTSWKASSELIDFLNQELQKSLYPRKMGKHIINLPTMCVFSVHGVDVDDTKKYIEWDSRNRERTKLIKKINEEFTDLHARHLGAANIMITKRNDGKECISNIIATCIYMADGIVKTEAGIEGDDFALVESQKGNSLFTPVRVRDKNEMIKIMEHS